ncbi:hypothetical protein THAOC_16846 [Thalassiosira oceanica]|uniref:Uncharacterized protein n=1 Tax=Thalassiosira oceanica TaxID=159749 RepID=K0SNL0_THAOC|nr:hypothetical protein THAOC_16846 [Thalassiosira oceanica]|eukprot:EJK62536.1 hypothetical protein THAOC_16846 [Thalassiosira oceanica]
MALGPMGIGWMDDGNLASGHPNCPTPCSFTPPTAPSPPREKSSAATPGEDCSPPHQVQINGLLPPKEVVTGASRPLHVHTSIENRPVHNLGSNGLSPHLDVVANKKQSHLFVYAILRWVRPLTRTVPLDSPGSVNPCHPARG